MTQEPLTLNLTFSSGDGELVVGCDHPLVGAFRRAIETGRPPGAWRYLLAYNQSSDVPVVLGTLVHTVGDRLLFFPAAQVTLDGENLYEPFIGRVLDHLTLDPPDPGSGSRSHVAVVGVPKDRSRGVGFRTVPPPGTMIPWFSLLTPGLDGFPVLPKELSVTFPPPRPDVGSFGDRLCTAGGLTVAPLPEARGNPNFLQVDVWVGRGPAWKALKTRPLAWSYKPELVRNPPPGTQDVQVAAGDLEFSRVVGVRLLALRPQGTLGSSHILRPRLDAERWLKMCEENTQPSSN
jgi:hypothetical protein